MDDDDWEFMARRPVPKRTYTRRDRERMDSFRAWFYDTYRRWPTSGDFADKSLWRKFTEHQARPQMSINVDLKNIDVEAFKAMYGVGGTRTGRLIPHTTVHDSTVMAYAEADAELTAAMTEGHNPMVMTRAELEAMQAGAARQLAEAEKELAKYARFPDEDELLERGTVIHFVKRFKERVPRRAEMKFNEDLPKYPQAAYAGDNMRRFNELLERVSIEPVGEPEDVYREYVYVGVHVAGRWYVTGAKGNKAYTYDELLKVLVDGDVQQINVMDVTTSHRDGVWSQSDTEPDREPEPLPEPKNLAVEDDRPRPKKA